MKKLFFSVAFIFLSCAWAEAITLEEALSDALAKNPAIKSAKFKYESVKAKVPQSMSLNDPWFTYKPDAEMDMREPAFEITQEIPFPTKLFSRGKVAESEAKGAYEEYLEKEKVVLAEVKTTYAELYLACKMIEVNKEVKELLGQAADSATKQYSVGKTGQSDALKAQVELAKVDGNLITWEQKKSSASAKLNYLLDYPQGNQISEAEVSRDAGLVKPLDELYVSAKESRSELRAMRHMIDKAKGSLNLAGQEYLPDFMVGYERMFDAGEDMWMVGATVPVWFFMKQNYGLKEMRADLAMAENEYKSAENMVMFEIKDFYSQMDADKKLKDLYETSLLPQADQSFKASLTAYESGQTDFLGLLDSERMLLETKMQYYEILVHLEIAIAELEKTVGIEVEKCKRKVLS